jgi:hypothetical protein
MITRHSLIGLAVVSVSCISMERTPSASDVRRFTAVEPFVVQPTGVTGVYQNVDIDSVVFYYVTNLASDKEFWQAVKQQATLAGWQHVDDAAAGSSQPRAYEAFQRLKRKGELRFASAEELRIAYTPIRVVVAYVQSDHIGAPTPVSQTAEGRFADREIWSRFTQLLSGSGGR